MSKTPRVAGTNSIPSEVDALLLNDEDAAHWLAISPSLFRKLHRMGKAPFPLRLGTCPRWRVDELCAWVRADCPDREHWMAMRDTALEENGRVVAPVARMTKPSPGTAA